MSKDNKGQTIVDRGGGQFPLWDDEVRLTLSRHDSTKLVVKVLSQEQSGEDDVLLGTGTAELGDPSKWPNHQFDGKCAFLFIPETTRELMSIKRLGTLVYRRRAAR